MKSEFIKIITALLIIVYLLLSLVTVFGEYEKDIFLIRLTKPFLIPILTLLYVFLTQKINWIYLLALLFVWFANMFFLIQTPEFIFMGGICYLIFWVFTTFIILTNTGFPNLRSFSIAIVPFLFVYCCVYQLVYQNINEGVYLFFLNGIFMVFLGGYSLANYFFVSSKSSTFLLISVLLFTFIQFLVSIDLYYVSINLFRPMAMMLFVSAQFFLLKTLLSYENPNLEEEQNA